MKVLWLTNLEAAPGASVADPDAARFGGWIANMLAALRETGELTLGVALRAPAKTLAVQEHHGVLHHYVPRGRGLAMDAPALAGAIADFGPDIVHIEGAEMPHAAQTLDAFDGPVLLSLQGVMHGLAPYEYGALPLPAWSLGLHKPTRALMAAATVGAKATRFASRQRSEAKVMARVGTIAGRTEWDRAYASALAPQARYHHVGRILRPPFYADRPRRNFERHRIFIGNANHPRKGAHFALAALKALSREFPGVSLVIAGEPPAQSAREWRKSIGYPAFLARLIARDGLGARVHYTGVLDAVGMAEELSRSHVFLLSSLIENSPNTLGEAMMLGLPCVCAFAGGAPDMAASGEEALFYRAEDPVAMAHQIARVFRSEALATHLGNAAAMRAAKNHDRDSNRDRLLEVYASLLPAGAADLAPHVAIAPANKEAA